MTNRIFAGNGAFGRVPLRPCDRVRSFYIASNFAEFVIDQREGFSLPRHYSPPRRRIVSSDSFATREYPRILENWKSFASRFASFGTRSNFGGRLFRVPGDFSVMDLGNISKAEYIGSIFGKKRGEAMRSSGRARAVRG